MDKSCRSFFFWTFCSRERTLAWLLAIVAVTLSRPLKKSRRPAKLSTHIRTHTHISVSLPHDFSLRLMKCDHSDSRDPIRKPTEEQVTPSIFLKKTHTQTHTQACRNTLIRPLYLMASVLEHVCVCVCVTGLSFRWLMEIFSHLRYYICSPGTTPLLPSDLRPDDIPVWPASSQSHDEWDGLIYIMHCWNGRWRPKQKRKETHLNSGRPSELCETLCFLWRWKGHVYVY